MLISPYQSAMRTEYCSPYLRDEDVPIIVMGLSASARSVYRVIESKTRE